MVKVYASLMSGFAKTQIGALGNLYEFIAELVKPKGLFRMRSDERVATLIEYALLFSLIGLICFASLRLLGVNVSRVFSNVSSNLATAGSGQGSGNSGCNNGGGHNVNGSGDGARGGGGRGGD
jgi:Flp pilus assembly pilin Flp